MPYSLKGRRVLVTAGSRGLGAVICEKFADEGAHIMVNYVSREDKAREVVANIKARGVQAFMAQGVSKQIPCFWVLSLTPSRTQPTQTTMLVL